jgi:predicted dehydrogenase
MIKIGLIGTGHLGKIHLRLLKELTDDFQIVGFYDQNPQVAAAIAAEFQVPAYDDMSRLIDHCEALDVVTTTTAHYEIARKVVTQSKHLFIEKPLTATLEEARSLVSLVNEANVKCQVGHVERFNPAIRALESLNLRPLYIEILRAKSPWNARGTDVSVVLDLTIHDIEIVQHLVKSPVKRVVATGTPVVSQSADIVFARIEFHNGAVANLNTNRVAFAPARVMRIYERNRHLEVDMGASTARVYHFQEQLPANFTGQSVNFEGGYLPLVATIEDLQVVPGNAIKEELRTFAQAIRENKQTPVTVEDGANAIDTAFQIIQRIENQ